MNEGFDALTNPGQTFTKKFGQGKSFKSPGEYFNYFAETYPNTYKGSRFPSANTFGLDYSMFDTFGETNAFNSLTSGFTPLDNLFG